MPNQPRAGLLPTSIRLEPELARRVEYRLEQLRKEHPGIRYEKTDVIREAIAKLPAPPAGWEPWKPAPAKPAAKKKRGA